MWMMADDIRANDRIMIERVWWRVGSIGPPHGGMRRMFITREGKRLSVRLATGQQWIVHRKPR